MSPNPVTAAATWTLALTVDALAIVAVVVVVAWDRHCTPGAFACPAGDPARRDALALGLLGGVLLGIAVLGLVRGRLLLVLVQLVLLAAAAWAAHREAPVGFDQLRHDLHLACVLAPMGRDAGS